MSKLSFLKKMAARVILSINKILYLKIRFYRVSGYWPNIKNPKTINENLLKLKINSKEDYYIYADKILVRDFISEQIVDHNLTKLRLPKIYLVSDNAEDFAKKFTAREAFIKTNHGSGMCFYFDGKDEIKLNSTQISLIKNWLNTDYSIFTGEACYKNVKRKVFAERPLKCKDGSLPDDIKVHCYFGKPAVIQVLRRTTGILQRKTYDENWIEKPWFKNEVLSPDLTLIPKEEVLSYAEILSAGFDYVRVDFYLVDDLLYFSELTFYPASASLPLASKKVDEELGEKYRRFCTDPVTDCTG